LVQLAEVAALEYDLLQMVVAGRQRYAGAGFREHLLSGLCNAEEQTQLNRGLKILYAGRPGADREKEFVGFLKKYFDVVRTGNLETFKEADTRGFDVTLLDWDTNEFKGPKPAISDSFSRPIVTLGVPGGLISLRWRLKTGYL
jgi:hypothetical protein